MGSHPHFVHWVLSLVTRAYRSVQAFWEQQACVSTPSRDPMSCSGSRATQVTATGGPTKRYGRKTNGSEVAKDHAAAIAGRTFFITGGTAGLGLETAAVLAEHGARVVLTGRGPSTVDPAVATVRARATAAGHARLPDGSDNVIGLSCDLSVLASVRRCAVAFAALRLPDLHVLINNAGVMASPLVRTADGLEQQFAVNHLGHFLLTQLLRPFLEATAGRCPPNTVRVVNLSSMAHHIFTPPEGIDLADVAYARAGYNPWGRYGQAKLANILHARELQRRFDADGAAVLTVAVHPGVIMGTTLMRHSSLRSMLSMFSYKRFWRYGMSDPRKTVQQGISTTLVAALASDVPRFAYYSHCVPEREKTCPAASDDGLAARLWTLSEELLATVGVSTAPVVAGSAAGVGAVAGK